MTTKTLSTRQIQATSLFSDKIEEMLAFGVEETTNSVEGLLKEFKSELTPSKSVVLSKRQRSKLSAARSAMLKAHAALMAAESALAEVADDCTDTVLLADG